MPLPVPVIVAVIGAIATIFTSRKKAEGKRAEADAEHERAERARAEAEAEHERTERARMDAERAAAEARARKKSWWPWAK